MRLFWLAISATVIVLLILLLVDSPVSTPMGSDQAASVAWFGIIGLLAAAGLLGSGMPLAHLLRNIFIWTALIFALMTGYNNRYELQDLAHRLTAGIIPSSLLSSWQDAKQSVTLTRTLNGHFEAAGLANSRPVHFLVDTGASSVVLSFAEARRVGVDTRRLRYIIPISTANGSAQAAPVVLHSLKIGAITRDNVRALVTRPDTGDRNLLGMSFLNRLSGYAVRGDRLFLYD